MVTDNKHAEQYELDVEGAIAFARYKRTGNRVALLHVEAPPQLRGTGAAGRLMQGIMDIAARENLEIVPVCSYAVTWMNRNAG